MKRFRYTATAIGLSMTLLASQGAPAQPSSTQAPKSALADPIANEGIVEDEAVGALKEMSTFLTSANTLKRIDYETDESD